MSAMGIQPWPRDEELESLLADEATGEGTLFGPVFSPGVESRGLARELRMAVQVREPKPLCGCCGQALRFEDIYLRLSAVRYGTDIAALCGDCLQNVFSRLRAVSFASGDDRHFKGMQALNSAFELMVMGRRAA